MTTHVSSWKKTNRFYKNRRQFASCFCVQKSVTGERRERRSPSSTEEKNATSGESAAVPCRARRPRRAAQQHQRRAVTSGQSAAFHCRGRRPRRPRSSTKVKFPRPANSQHLIVGKGLALSAQHTLRHGKSRANALHARGFARGRRESGHFLPEGASPFPTGRCLRIRPTARETGTLLRGTPGTAFPTWRVRICRMWNQVIAVCCGGRPRAGRRPLQGRCVLSPISFPQRGKVASADPPRGG